MVHESQDIKTIRVTAKTHKKLSDFCLKVESYDEAIQRLLREEKERESKTPKANYEDDL